jgi:hypothetical protein
MGDHAWRLATEVPVYQFMMAAVGLFTGRASADN